MDNQQGHVRTRWRMSYGFKSVLRCFGYIVVYYFMYERELLCKILIRSLYIVNFNVSNTKDNAHAKISRYV
jgi:hypothetical protein